LKPSCVDIGEFEREVGEETQLLVLVLDQWIVNVGEVVVDEDESVGMVVERRDKEDDEIMDVVRVGSVVLDDERTGGTRPFRTGLPLDRCQ
jgi:hypothetical protein